MSSSPSRDKETLDQEDPEKFLFASDPDRCCEIRKVRPLAEAMEGYDAWITGRKGFQSDTRATLPLFEAEGERVKINPLVGWSASDVLTYISGSGPAASSAGRQGLPLDRLPALHQRGQARRGRARRPLARPRQDGMRHPCRRARRRGRHLMPFWRRDGFVEDQWTTCRRRRRRPDTGAIIVSLKRWLAERDALERPRGARRRRGRRGRGRRRSISPTSPSRPFVALGFAKFADGRAFSYARLLRDRFGFKGEMRAAGDVLIDEISFMLRCGFDSFVVMNEPTIRALEAGRLPGPPDPLSAGEHDGREAGVALSAVADGHGNPDAIAVLPAPEIVSARAGLPACGLYAQ